MDPYDHDLERGLANRRAMLGDAWVDKSVANATAFSADFQNFITRYAWHEVWGRPGLDAKTRRVIVLTITCALGRWEEFELHLRAALSAGEASTRLSPDEVKEVLMQAAIYAGVPAANTGMSIAAKLLRELGEPPPPRPATEAYHTGVGRAFRSAALPALHYTVRDARRDSGKPTLVMSHALGCDASLWDALANSLAAEHRVVCYDHRGHGDSEAPHGPYTMTSLAEDADHLLAELDARYATGPVVWIGLSLGGMVGQELALAHPRRLKALVIANSTSRYDEAGRAQWAQRIAAVEAGGPEAVADGAMQRWFHEGFHAEHPEVVAHWRARVLACDPSGYIACCQAISAVDTTTRLPRIQVPTLVIAGEEDRVYPPSLARRMAERIRGAQLVVLEGCGHLSNLEQPERFNEALLAFLSKVEN